VKECQQIIHKSDRWKYVNLNPTVPTIRGLVKGHKEGAPIRPTVNWKNAPAYKLAILLARKIHTYIPLPYTFNVENTVQLMNDLTDLPYDHNIKFASLGINNIYSNIPIKEMITILCEISNLEDKIKQDILNITQVIAEKRLFPLSGHDLRTKRRSSNGSSKLRFFQKFTCKVQRTQNRRTTIETQSGSLLQIRR
jgi:hypothetical protein